jgi:hypothetical protein
MRRKKLASFKISMQFFLYNDVQCGNMCIFHWALRSLKLLLCFMILCIDIYSITCLFNASYLAMCVNSILIRHETLIGQADQSEYLNR